MRERESVRLLRLQSGFGDRLPCRVLNARDQLAYGQVVAVIVVIGAIGYVLDLVARRALSSASGR